jgi:transcriptional regulator with XRE-family HTH domain
MCPVVLPLSNFSVRLVARGDQIPSGQCAGVRPVLDVGQKVTEAVQDTGDSSLGAEIRRRRKQRGLTLVALAEQARVSQPFLSQLERGKARPSMLTLSRVATALETTEVELMLAATIEGAEHSQEQVSQRVIRAGEGIQVPREPDASGTLRGSSRLLARGQPAFYPQEYIEVREQVGPYYVHDEDEWIYVAEGSVLVDLAKDGTTVLSLGDSLYYCGGTPHRWHIVNCAQARLVVVKQRIGRIPATRD